jgi:hypothetical protein
VCKKAGRTTIRHAKAYIRAKEKITTFRKGKTSCMHERRKKMHEP